MFKICLVTIGVQRASPFTYAWCSHVAGQNETEQQAAAEAAAATGLLRPIRHLVSITDMAAGLSAVTGGLRNFPSMAWGQPESSDEHCHDRPGTTLWHLQGSCCIWALPCLPPICACHARTSACRLHLALDV